MLNGFADAPISFEKFFLPQLIITIAILLPSYFLRVDRYCYLMTGWYQT